MRFIPPGGNASSSPLRNFRKPPTVEPGKAHRDSGAVLKLRQSPGSGKTPAL